MEWPIKLINLVAENGKKTRSEGRQYASSSYPKLSFSKALIGTGDWTKIWGLLSQSGPLLGPLLAVFFCSLSFLSAPFSQLSGRAVLISFSLVKCMEDVKNDCFKSILTFVTETRCSCVSWQILSAVCSVALEAKRSFNDGDLCCSYFPPSVQHQLSLTNEGEHFRDWVQPSKISERGKRL